MPRCRCGLSVRKILYDALPLYLDDAPLSRLGEFDARVRGIRTFSLYGANVIRRTAREIEQFPEPFGGLVFREHVCNSAVPDALTHRTSDRYAGDDPGF